MMSKEFYFCVLCEKRERRTYYNQSFCADCSPLALERKAKGQCQLCANRLAGTPHGLRKFCANCSHELSLKRWRLAQPEKQQGSCVECGASISTGRNGLRRFCENCKNPRRNLQKRVFARKQASPKRREMPDPVFPYAVRQRWGLLDCSGSFQEGWFYRLYKLQGGSCVAPGCGKFAQRPTHIVPLVENGAHACWNVMLACEDHYEGLEEAGNDLRPDSVKESPYFGAYLA